MALPPIAIVLPSVLAAESQGDADNASRRSSIRVLFLFMTNPCDFATA